MVGLMHSARSGVMILAFALAMGLQIVQSPFLSPSLWVPLYTIMGFVFFGNALFFLFNLHAQKERWAIHLSLIALDILGVSVLVSLTGGSRSFFFFLYLVQILISALILGRPGAVISALWASVCYSVVLIFHARDEGLIVLAALNNTAFFAMAFVGGLLAEQLFDVDRELKARTRDLTELTNFHQLIVENIPTGLMTVSSSGIITSANPAGSQILDGLDLVDRPLSELFPSIVLDSNVVALRGGQPVQQQEVTFINKSKEKILLDVTLSSFSFPGVDESGFVLLFQDRTEVKRLEQAIRQKEKLAAVGQLAAGIAHEIRNPLASLSGSVQLMTSQPERFTDEDMRLMRIILREIDRLNGLISEFLDYVRPPEPPTEVVDLNGVLNDVAEMVKMNKSLRPEIQISTELQAGSMIIGDRNKLVQAFLNLAINACQAMDQVAQPQLVLKTVDRIERVEVEVTDNGSGMNEVTRQRIFEPFYTTKSKGTGLGLALTHKILEAHDAEVQVLSEEGRGTTFRVFFKAEHTHKGRGRPKSISA